MAMLVGCGYNYSYHYGYSYGYCIAIWAEGEEGFKNDSGFLLD